MSVEAERKARLREAALAARASTADPKAAVRAQASLAALLGRFKGRPLSGYLPIGSEIDPRPVMAGWSGPVGIPVVAERGTPLVFAEWNAADEMVRGPLGVPQPRTVRPMRPEVLIVPCLAFDSGGRRLGYGGGYYDRTLAALRDGGEIFTVGFAYAGQQMPSLPAEPFDAPLDAVVTEAGPWIFSPDALQAAARRR